MTATGTGNVLMRSDALIYYSEQLSDADLKWIDLHFMRYYLITPSDRVLFVEWQNYPIRKKRLGEWQKWNKNHPIIDSSLKPHFNTYD